MTIQLSSECDPIVFRQQSLDRYLCRQYQSSPERVAEMRRVHAAFRHLDANQLPEPDRGGDKHSFGIG